MQAEYIWGIDPGSKGALAIIRKDRSEVFCFRYSKYSESEFAGIFRSYGLYEAHCYLEKVNALPGEGVKSVFSFGRNFGFLRGLLLANYVSFEEVPPQVWQRKLGLGKAYPSKTERKNAQKERAQQLFPNLKVTLEHADALLIAEYGWRTYYK